MIKELISVIVPIYNCEKYLHHCIESILKQNYYNFELLLIDDGSVDESVKICKRFSADDKRIRVIKQENKGVAKARENGILHAKGQYIVFVDADDYLYDDFLNVLYNAFSEDVDIVCCNYVEQYGKEFKKNRISHRNDSIYTLSEMLSGYYEKENYPFTVWAKMYRMSCFDKAQFKQMKYSEDNFLILSMFPYIKGIKLIEYIGYVYRRHNESVTMNADAVKKSIDSLFVAELAFGICQKNELDLKSSAESQLINYYFGAMRIHCRLGNESQIRYLKERFGYINTNIKAKRIVDIVKQKLVRIYALWK